ncbi:MAG: peptidylprolyl isomerase [Candidatus Woesearchaeota archaeon]
MADKEHVCDECDKSFRTKKGLELHKKNKHSDKKEDSKKSKTKSKEKKKSSGNKKSKDSKKSSKKSKKTNKKSKKSSSKKSKKKDTNKKSSKKKSSKKKKDGKDSKSKTSVASKKEKKEVKEDKSKKEKKTNENKKDDKKSKKENSFLKTVAIILILVAVVGGLFYFGRELANRGDDNGDIQQSEDQVLVKVNGEDITQSELDFFLNMVPPEASQMMGEDAILEQLVTQRLILQEAEKAGISFTQEQVEQMYADSMMQAGVGEEEFKELLTQMDLDEDDFKKYLEQQMIMNEFLENEIFNQINISEEDARELYNENPEQFMTVNAKHILICHNQTEQCEDNRTREEAEELAESLYTDATVDNFEELATNYSNDQGSAVQGGDLGEFGRGEMIPEFDQVVFDELSVGEISEPFETQFGYHIVYLTEKSGQSFEEVKENVEDSLRQQQSDQAVELYLQQLKENSEIEYVNDDLQLDNQEDSVDVEPEDDSSLNQEETQLSESEECYAEDDLADSVLYIYDDGCPHCQDMLPIVDELITEGHAIEKVNTKDRQTIDTIMSCSPGQISGVPAYVCPTTGESFAGAVSKSELEDFIAECI